MLHLLTNEPVAVRCTTLLLLLLKKKKVYGIAVERALIIRVSLLVKTTRQDIAFVDRARRVSSMEEEAEDVLVYTWMLQRLAGAARVKYGRSRVIVRSLNVAR